MGRVEQFKNSGKKRLRPHGGVPGGRESVEQDCVRLRQPFRQRGAEQTGKIAHLQFPGDGLSAILKRGALSLEQRAQRTFKTDQVLQLVQVVKSEVEWIEGMIEADQADRAGNIAERAQDREWI